MVKTRDESRPEAETKGKRDTEAQSGDVTFRFDDPYWDDAFATFYDPAMRVCSVFGC